jgi:hypothetical protein
MRKVHLVAAAAIWAWAAFTAAELASTDDPTPVDALLPASLLAKDSHQPAWVPRPSSLTCNFAESMRGV